MFIFDIIRRDDRRLQVLAAGMLGGMAVLLAGLWFVQIVATKKFEHNLERQSFRSVATPALRGRILDRDGRVLAENRPRYNAVVYLEDLREAFAAEYKRMLRDYGREHPQAVKANGSVSIKDPKVRRPMQLEADCRVVKALGERVSGLLRAPYQFNTNGFLAHYNSYPYLPYQLLDGLGPEQVALYSEVLSGQSTVELETQPVRYYPQHTLAAHLLGYVQRRDEPGGQAFHYYDYGGKVGVEYAFDTELSGQEGEKMVLVNNQSYRQHEDIAAPSEPGDDVYLTIDAAIQQAAEKALAVYAANSTAAAVVMDVRNGDVLAMASWPTFDPNSFVTSPTLAEWRRMTDPVLSPQLNRVTQGAYPPGSTFKIITAVACFESGLDPDEIFTSPGRFGDPGYHTIADPAGPGDFNFERAFYRSSNTYFIHYGMKAGLRKLLEVARRFHLGEKTGIVPSREERSGIVPPPEQAGKTLPNSSTPDVCIGQEVFVTPIQMTTMIAAIANGGTLFWPRIASHSRSPIDETEQELFAAGRVRDRVQLDPHHLELIRRAMLDDTEHAPDATAYEAFHQPRSDKPYLPGFRVAGKTGTAEIKGRNIFDKITWFDSYGPYENPRYAVVVMVQSGGSGGGTCAPAARCIYEAIVKREQSAASPAREVAGNH